MTNGFPGLVAVPENADVFAAEEFTPSSSASLAVSIQMATAAMLGDKNAPTFQVMGSNVSTLVGDMVPVKDESGISGPLALNIAWVRNNFPFKFIGIQYLANGNVGAGTLSVTIEKKAQQVKVS